MTWKIDDSHSYVGFSVKHMMVSTVRGQFHVYSGELHVDEQELTQSFVSGEIEVASIDTRNTQRDDHLRSADFFDAPNFPKITYHSTRVEALGPNEFKVYGDLTIRGVTREVALDVEYAGQSKDPWGGTRAGFSASGIISRKDFGLTWNALLETGGVAVADKIQLQLDIELVLEAAPVAAEAITV